MLPKVKHLFPGDLGIDIFVPEKCEHIDPVLRALNCEFELKLQQNVSFNSDNRVHIDVLCVV
jgi:hypothetical protein